MIEEGLGNLEIKQSSKHAMSNNKTSNPKNTRDLIKALGMANQSLKKYSGLSVKTSTINVDNDSLSQLMQVFLGNNSRPAVSNIGSIV